MDLPLHKDGSLIRIDISAQSCDGSLCALMELLGEVAVVCSHLAQPACIKSANTHRKQWVIPVNEVR